MAEYLAPGVYVEEFDSGAVPIEGVSTSTAGFVGVTERGSLLPKLVTSWTEFVRAYGGHTGTDTSYLPYAVQGFFTNGGKRAYIARVTGAAAAPAWVALGKSLTIHAAGPGTWGDNLRVTIRRAATEDASKAPTENSLLRVDVALYTADDAKIMDGNDATPKRKVRPLASEMFDNVTLDPSSGSFIGGVVNSASNLIRIEPAKAAPAAGAGGGAGPAKFAPEKGQDAAGQFKATTLALSAGADDDADAAAYKGVELPLSDGTKYRTGMKALSEIDDISLVVVPDAIRDTLSLNSVIQEHCELLGYRFGVLSDKQGATDPAKMSTGGIDSQYTALYTPWVRVLDQSTNRYELVPPVGHVAGVYARTDVERGVHKAPANEVLRGIMVQDRGTQKPLARAFSKGEQDVLNPKGINVIRDFRSTGRGIRVWGARTMSSNGLWKYVNVRRLFIFVEASLDKGTQWVVFEPNDAPTWTRVVASVTSFLTRVWKSGALMGSTEQEAFYVRCDRTTMTQDDIDNGRLVVLVGIAPVKPAEFVVLRITQKTASEDA